MMCRLLAMAALAVIPIGCSDSAKKAQERERIAAEEAHKALAKAADDKLEAEIKARIAADTAKAKLEEAKDALSLWDDTDEEKYRERALRLLNQVIVLEVDLTAEDRAKCVQEAKSLLGVMEKEATTTRIARRAEYVKNLPAIRERVVSSIDMKTLQGLTRDPERDYARPPVRGKLAVVVNSFFILEPGGSNLGLVKLLGDQLATNATDVSTVIKMEYTTHAFSTYGNTGFPACRYYCDITVIDLDRRTVVGEWHVKAEDPKAIVTGRIPPIGLAQGARDLDKQVRDYLANLLPAAVKEGK